MTAVLNCSDLKLGHFLSNFPTLTNEDIAAVNLQWLGADNKWAISKHGNSKGYVFLDVSCAEAIEKGTASTLMKVSVATAVLSALAKEKVEWHHEGKTLEDALIENVEIVKGASSAKPPAKPKSKKSSTKKVKLLDATEVGQPVHGTGPSSIYHAVAISSEFNIAARYSSGNVSVRVEGKGYPSLKLNEMGFKQSADGDGNVTHWSLHCHCNPEISKRVIGAVIVGLDHEFESVLTKFSLVSGFGK